MTNNIEFFSKRFWHASWNRGSHTSTRRTLMLSLLGIFALNSISPSAVADETKNLNSPYFIDGVKCEGINYAKLEDLWIIPSSKEEEEEANKFEQQQTCER